MDQNMNMIPTAGQANKPGQLDFAAEAPQMEGPKAGTESVSVFQFEFHMNGKHYRARIKESPTKGYEVELLKKFADDWQPSYSRVAFGILGYFIAQQAVTAAVGQQSES